MKKGDYNSVIGYTNPSRVFPAPIITIINEGDQILACYPNLERLKIESEIDKVKNLASFIEEKTQKKLGQNEYSFAIKPSNIITGSPKDILKILLGYLSTTENEVEKQRIRRFLKSEFKNPHTDSSSLDHLKFFRVFITDRIKKNKQKAHRLILQIRTNTGFKTFYKKNFNLEEIIHTSDIRIEERINASFRNRTEKEFFYKTA